MRLIIDGVKVYELDEECLKRKGEKEKKNTKEQNQKQKMKQNKKKE